MAEAHEEFQELQENAERASHERPMAVVSLTMAILAVLVAVVTLMSHRSHIEEVVLQTRVTDQWAYYQAKNIRRDSYEMFLDHLAVTPTKDPESAAKTREKYEAALEHERERQKEIQGEARKMEQEIGVVGRRANRFDLGLGLLEAALVITSITLLTGLRGFWLFGSAVAVAGVVIAVTGFLIHL
jgi:hypothetical protein